MRSKARFKFKSLRVGILQRKTVGWEELLPSFYLLASGLLPFSSKRCLHPLPQVALRAYLWTPGPRVQALSITPMQIAALWLHCESLGT